MAHLRLPEHTKAVLLIEVLSVLASSIFAIAFMTHENSFAKTVGILSTPLSLYWAVEIVTRAVPITSRRLAMRANKHSSSIQFAKAESGRIKASLLTPPVAALAMLPIVMNQTASNPSIAHTIVFAAGPLAAGVAILKCMKNGFTLDLGVS